jgi:2-dehydro-3-deoxyglucarate aldolase/4-hydroxy-2-oxoheptanedioate aldolase
MNKESRVTRPSALDEGRLRNRILAGDTLVGTFAGMASPVAVEVVAVAGADWVLIDLEHGAGGEEQVAHGVVAARAYGVPVIVRVESAERIRVGRALDLGAAGIMFPRIDNAREAEAAIATMQYPPRGTRGAATYNRQGRFGLDRDVLGRVGEQLAGVVQIESAEALEDCESIAAIEGVDALFVGPVDLSYALGVPLQFDSRPFREALERVLRAARGAGIAAGIMSGTVEAARASAEEGFTFISIGSDATVLAQSLQRAFDQVRPGGE